VFLEVSSYSNPTAVVEHAGHLGFKLIDFQLLPVFVWVLLRGPGHARRYSCVMA
jgi:hypothetical protein